MTKLKHNCDLLVISPHTDDAEIGLGGTIATLCGRGRQVWVLDLTRGELGSNATVDQRWQEADQASAILGLTGRIQMDLPDGFINPTDRAQIEAVVWALRTFRPQTLITAPDPVRHPDHIATRALVRRAVFLSRLQQLAVRTPDFRSWEAGAALPQTGSHWIVPGFFSVCPDAEKPSLLFDVTEKWHLKEEALAAYASQFQRAPGRRETHINDGGFLEKIGRRTLRWGDLAGKKRAEAFITESIPVVSDFSDAIEWRP